MTYLKMDLLFAVIGLVLHLSTGSRRGLYFQGIISNAKNVSLAPALFCHGIGSKFWDILINVEAVHYELLIYMRQ
ncbi:hypothetical protein ARMGADRAFT_1093315 [Armillaria gallica]|uniref:Secreted protein n=1 Tax=Armillaria gallica TaxID=47427 RepID=A0A2H3C864_ARMGA|nr:hypothetical protein ARMGADRAFT_1093315 [Armillaria gallica]